MPTTKYDMQAKHPVIYMLDITIKCHLKKYFDLSLNLKK